MLQTNAATRTSYSSLDEISSHAFILCVSESQCFLGPSYLIVCTYSPKLYFSHSVVKGKTFYLKTPHRSQSPEKHLQTPSISIKTSISKMQEWIKISLTRHLAHLQTVSSAHIQCLSNWKWYLTHWYWNPLIQSLFHCTLSCGNLWSPVKTKSSSIRKVPHDISEHSGEAYCVFLELTPTIGRRDCTSSS